jgi:hypothetical protein
MYYIVIVTYKHDKEVVHLAESRNLAEMKHLAELICRNALPEICSVKIDNGYGELVCYWMATPWTKGNQAVLECPPDRVRIN